MVNGFIEQTAKDYDMTYSEVELIYCKWNDKGLFYEKLEEWLNEMNNDIEYFKSTLSICCKSEVTIVNTLNDIKCYKCSKCDNLTGVEDENGRRCN